MSLAPAWRLATSSTPTECLKRPVRDGVLEPLAQRQQHAVPPADAESAARRRRRPRPRAGEAVRAREAPRASRDQEDLPLVLPVEHVLHGGAGVLEGERAIDDRPESSLDHVVEDRSQLEDRAEIRAEDPEVLGVHVAEVEPPPVRVVGADRDERTEPREGIDGLLESITADVLDDDVDAALARPRLGLLDEVLRAVVHDTLGAERFRELD